MIALVLGLREVIGERLLADNVLPTCMAVIQNLCIESFTSLTVNATLNTLLWTSIIHYLSSVVTVASVCQ